ncbi:MAG: peptidylprolyl isomerase [Bacteroidia bacterium]
MTKQFFRLTTITILISLQHPLFSQPSKVIDMVAAVVGNKIIMKSDIEAQYVQYLGEGNYANENIKCGILDNLLFSKLLLHQAILDSVEVTEAQIQEKLDRNIEFYIKQIGSQEKLEQYYGKTVLELKDEYRPLIRDQLLVQSMQQKVTKDVSASPADVRAFFAAIPPDSLPYINAEVEYAQILRKIPVSATERERIKQQLQQYKERINKGEEFATLAVLYSQDNSAKNGGELGLRERGELVPEFESAAFRLKPGQVSDVVETKFGFHLIQMIERRGEQFNVRHILMKPKTGAEDLAAAKAFTDSIYLLIKENKMKFEEAAEKFSDDTDTRNNGGNIFNPQTGNTRFESDQVSPADFFQLDKLKPGEVSSPVLSQTAEGNQVYKLYKLHNRTEPHRANLTDDYQRLQEAALESLQNKLINEWVKKKRNNVFVQISKEYSTCENLKNWMN